MPELPRNLDAERALLCSIMLDPRHYPKLRPRITPDLFYGELHAELAGVIDRVHRSGQDITMLSVLHEIDRDDDRSRRFRDTKEGMELLVGLTAAQVPSNAAETYLQIVEETSRKRSILAASEEIAAICRNGADSADLAKMFRAYSQRMEALLSRTEEVRTVDVLHALSQQLPPVPWIVDGWLGEGDLVLFAGEWATGKSVIALDLAIAVATGMPWLGKMPVTKPGPVLYVDEENNARNVTRRLARMIRGRNIDPGEAASIQLRYLSKNALRLDGPGGLATLRKEIEATKPVLVVLDSLIRFHSASENDNTEIAALFAQAIIPLATKHGCAFVVLDHMRKPSKDDERFDAGHRMRGAGDKAGVGDGLWTLEGDRETDQRTLSCRKNRWEDSLPPAVTTSWKVSDDETAAWIEAKDATLSAEVAVKVALSSTPGGMLASQLYDRMEALGTPKRTAVRVVKRLSRTGVIESRKEGGRCVRYWIGTLIEEAIR